MNEKLLYYSHNFYSRAIWLGGRWAIHTYFTQPNLTWLFDEELTEKNSVYMTQWIINGHLVNVNFHTMSLKPFKNLGCWIFFLNLKYFSDWSVSNKHKLSAEAKKNFAIFFCSMFPNKLLQLARKWENLFDSNIWSLSLTF